MLFELHTGVLLFQTHDSYQHLALICKRLESKVPWRLVEKCNKESFFETEAVDGEGISGYKGERATEDTRETRVSLIEKRTQR